MKPALDENYWNNRYLTNESGWDVGEISTPLKTYFDQLQTKNLKILIPGAGNAYEAEYLVNNGFENVYVCDLTIEPLNNLQKRCPAFKTGQLIHSNFFDLGGQDFDLIIEQAFFCAIDPNLRKKYFEQVSSLLKPGGKLVGVLFDDKLNNDKPPFGGNKEEYLTYIGNDFHINTFSNCYNSIKPRAGRELFVLLVKT